jgi:acetylornithine deacetylase/succinyl-diaminopimelate desuccinylase-like protein
MSTTNLHPVELLEKLVKINSISPVFGNPSGEVELGKFIEEYLQRLNFKTKRQYVEGERFNLLGEKGEGTQSILLYGHLDTIGIAEGWAKSEAFKLKEKGGKIYGLGVCDMKGGIAVILKVIEEIQPKRYKIKVVFGVDEENYSLGVNKLIESDFLSDVLFALVPETAYSFNPEKKKIRITIGRRGRVEILLTISGKTQHGGYVVEDRGAIFYGIKICSKLQQMKFGEYKIDENNTLPYSLIVTHISTPPPSILVSPEIKLVLDYHFPLPLNFSSSTLDNLFLPLFKKYLPTFPFTLTFHPRPTPYPMPYYVSRSNRYLQKITSLISSDFGGYVYNYGLSCGDENFLVKKIPTITIGLRGGDIHSPYEWIEKDSLQETIEIYKKIINIQ